MKGYNLRMSQKKKTKKKSSVIPKIIGIAFLLIALVISTKVGKEVIGMVTLQRQQKEVEQELKKLEDENASLIATKEKLEDPNYVSTYARGEYMFSKGDEKLFRLPSSKE